MNQTPVTDRALGPSLARSYLQLASYVASGVLGIGISILLGFSPLPRSFPLIVFAQTYPQAALVVGTLLVALTVIALLASERAQWTRRITPPRTQRAAAFGASALVCAVGSGLLGILFGLGDLPTAPPLLQLVRTHPPLGIGLVGLLLALIILAPVFAFAEGLSDPQRGGRNMFGSPLLLSIGISAVSSVLFVALLGVVLVRPTWCPTSVCPAPVIIHPANSVYDANLEVYPVAVQSATYAIPGRPDQYSLQQRNLLRQIEATRIDVLAPPLRVVVGVHNLLRSAHDDILIEHVTVLLDHVEAVPSQLNVWTPGEDIDYTTNPMTAVYRGEPVGAKLEAFSTLTPPALIHLNAGESDQIDVQLVGQTVALITFRIEVAYHVTTQAAIPTLTLTQPYTVVFGAAANWHVYQLQEGHLIPVP